jgi:cellulose synthase/poly-beta-1,6-N-acetylglucosamine synthase-like glycosyltransferase
MSHLYPFLCVAQAGWFPEYTITEDYALSMELKLAGFRGRYLPEYLAVSAVTRCRLPMCCKPLAECSSCSFLAGPC